ncbi:hypothetical protein SHIRM173S_03810 [Streptomyces hirsutus]
MAWTLLYAVELLMIRKLPGSTGRTRERVRPALLTRVRCEAPETLAPTREGLESRPEAVLRRCYFCRL